MPLTLFDIKQIEVFKGPNSTLFGQNATGGNIHITTNNPHKYKSYTGSYSLENYNSSSINLRLSNSLTDHLFYNTSITKYYSDGWIKNKQLNASKDKIIFFTIPPNDLLYHKYKI